MTPKLPACTPREVERVLFKVGFIAHHQVGSHRIFRERYGVRRVTVPMHRGDLKRKTLRAIIRQAGLTPQDFFTLLRNR